MKRKILSAGNIFAAVFLILAALCLVAGIRTLYPAYVFAEEENESPVEEPQTTELNGDEFTVELVADADLTYTGSAVTPAAVVKHGETELVNGTDYTLSYENNVNVTAAGATVTVTGAGTYTGTLSLGFQIRKAQNAWLVYPSAVGWRYGEYDAAATYIMAEPRLGAENMTLMVSYDTPEGSSFLQFGNEVSFNLEDGKLPQAVSEKFAALDAGTYYLVASVGGNANYDGLNLVGSARGVKFVVSRATNTWLTTPGIVQWSYGSFNSSANIIKAIPQYPLTGNKSVTFGVYTDASCYGDYAWEGLEEITVANSTASGVVMNSVKSEIFRRLPAGTYYLNAVVDGNNNYTGLNTAIQFEVLPAQNYWKTTPQIVPWTYGGYNKESNVITAIPNLGEREDVVFGIFLDGSFGQSADGLGEFKFEKIVEPVRDENGIFIRNNVTYVLPEEIAGDNGKLAKLGAGDYYLRAVIEGEQGSRGSDNYATLVTSVPFRISQKQNAWITTPSVFGWDYGQFDKNVNAVKAEAADGETVVAIYYADGDPVAYSDNGKIVTSFKFIEEDGVLSVPEYVVAALKGLGAGKYYMLASVEGTKDYSGLNGYTSAEDIKLHGVEFEVSATANGWVTVPMVASWSDGHYDAEVNKFTAEAKSGNDKMKIFVIDANGRILTSNDGGNSLDYDVIRNLDVGSYTVRFTVEGTNDYSSLSGETGFAVYEDSVGLTGIIAAAIVFAVFDIAAAAVCISLIILRRKKIEEGYRKMIRKELHRR